VTALGTPQTDTIQGPLALGSRGKDVQTLQSLQNGELQPSPGLMTDGVFGMKTAAAVRAFQLLRGLKADGVVGPLICKELGVKFLFQPPPKPLPNPPGLPQPTNATSSPRAILFGVIAAGLKRIFKKAEQEIRDQVETDDNTAALDRAVKQLKSGLGPALMLLSASLPDTVTAQFLASQARTALLLMFAGMTRAALEVQAAGGDKVGILETALELNRINPLVGDVVRDTLEGGHRIDGAVRDLRSLMDPVAE
jgi:peptidoglycan hydrolase-like protein with peptidoglycan-binding domain